MDEHDAVTVQHPVFDENGILIWDLQIEQVFQRNADSAQKCSVLLNATEGLKLAILMGLVRQGAYRQWEIRVAVLPNDGDDGADYSIDYDYPGETAPQKKYPRLPVHSRVTGSLADFSEIADKIDFHFSRFDVAAEEAYQQAVTDTQQHMAVVMSQFLQPKPWWKFW